MSILLIISHQYNIFFRWFRFFSCCCCLETNIFIIISTFIRLHLALVFLVLFKCLSLKLSCTQFYGRFYSGLVCSTLGDCHLNNTPCERERALITIIECGWQRIQRMELYTYGARAYSSFFVFGFGVDLSFYCQFVVSVSFFYCLASTIDE